MSPKTLTDLRSEFRNYYFDRDAARRVVRFFEKELTHQVGELAGEQFRLQKWQRYILRHFFGWKHRETHLRKYRTLYLEIPRKNGKSILAAGLSLYLLDADNEPSARVVCFARNEDQAKEAVFDIAREMVNNNPKMSERITMYRRSMVVLRTASNFKLLTGVSRGKHGKNLSAMIGDEVHEYDDRELVDTLRTSMAARQQPVEIYLTTAGFDRASICWEMHDYAISVGQGVIKDPSFMGVIFAAGDNDDWKSPKTWEKANPNIDVSVKRDYLARECARAIEIPGYENTFKRLHLNIWTEQDSRWLPIDKWDACRSNFTEADLLGKPCTAALDLSTRDDLTSLVLLFLDEGRFRVLPFFWLPKETIARRWKRDRVPYEQWVSSGLIRTTDTPTIDYAVVRRDINELRNKFHIRELVMDKWNANQTAVELSQDGLEVLYWMQTFAALTAPTKELGSLVVSKKIEHNGNDVLRWMARNVAVEQDAAGNLKPSKKKSKEKIDGIVALIMALGRIISTEQNAKSIYDNGGLLTC